MFVLIFLIACGVQVSVVENKKTKPDLSFQYQYVNFDECAQDN